MSKWALGKMVYSIFHIGQANGNCELPKKGKRDYLSVYLKPEAFKHICYAQRWHKGKYTKFGTCLGVSRQYATGIAKGKFSCSDWIIPLIVLLARGRTEGCWCHMFCIRVKASGINSNHPMFNEAKYQGQVPYEKYSLSGEFRQQQYEAEIKGKK